MSTKEQGPALPATLLPVLLAALGTSPWAREEASSLCLLPYPEHWSPGPLSIGVTFSSGQPEITNKI